MSEGHQVDELQTTIGSEKLNLGSALENHQLKLGYVQSHYIIIAQGGIFSRAIHD